MTLAYCESEQHPLVEAVLRRAAARPRSADIDARDEMFADALAKSRGDRDGALVSYFSSGLEVADSVAQIVEDLFPCGVAKVLDFGCGFGRVSRFLAARLSAAESTSSLWASDIVAATLAFQASQFGAGTFPSAHRPEELVAPGDFDLIYVGSLFTHLPESTFFRWLECLAGLLSERGVLAFTVHDQGLMPPHHRLPASGLCFEAASESRTLDPESYGSSWVSPDFVERQIAQLRGSGPAAAWHHRRISRGLCNYQDLHLVSRQGELDRLRYDGGAFVRIEHCDLVARGELVVSGWAVSRFAGFQAAEISVELEQPERVREIGHTQSSSPRPDCFERLSDIGLDAHEIAGGQLDRRQLLHSGWQCRCQLPETFSASDAMLVISARTERASRIVFAGTLDQALFLAAEENFRRRYDRAYQLEQVIARMKRSRFWQLRKHWFTLKRALRLTEES